MVVTHPRLRHRSTTALLRQLLKLPLPNILLGPPTQPSSWSLQDNSARSNRRQSRNHRTNHILSSRVGFRLVAVLRASHRKNLLPVTMTLQLTNANRLHHPKVGPRHRKSTHILLLNKYRRRLQVIHPTTHRLLHMNKSLRPIQLDKHRQYRHNHPQTRTHNLLNNSKDSVTHHSSRTTPHLRLREHREAHRRSKATYLTDQVGRHRVHRLVAMKGSTGKTYTGVDVMRRNMRERLCIIIMTAS